MKRESRKTLIINTEYMDPDGETKTTTNERKKSKTPFSKRLFAYASIILQPIWVRCRSIFADTMDRRFMEGQLYYVLYCGVFFWSILIFHEIIK